VSNDSVRRSPAGFLQDHEDRIGRLERALVRAVPGRLSSDGQETKDWNLATETGFYWCTNTAANKPMNSSFQTGVVYRNSQPGFLRIVQEVRQPSSYLTSGGAGQTSNSNITWTRVGFRANESEPWSWTIWRRTDKKMAPTTSLNITWDHPRARATLNAGTKFWSFNGIFTSDFRLYRINFEFFTGQTNGAWFRLRKNGVDEANNHYNWQTLYIAGTGTPAGAQGVGNTGTYPPNGAQGFNGYIEVSNPMYTLGTQTQKQIRGHWNSFGGASVAIVQGQLGNHDTEAYDGFTLALSDAGLAGVTAESQSWITVEGLA
jgi:hypothetical protein